MIIKGVVHHYCFIYMHITWRYATHHLQLCKIQKNYLNIIIVGRQLESLHFNISLSLNSVCERPAEGRPVQECILQVEALLFADQLLFAQTNGLQMLYCNSAWIPKSLFLVNSSPAWHQVKSPSAKMVSPIRNVVLYSAFKPDFS